LSGAASLIAEAAPEIAVPGKRRLQGGIVALAIVLLGSGAALLARTYGFRQAVLFLIGAGCGLVLHHAAFGFTAAWRALVLRGDGRGLRAQLLMLAAATVLFAPILASGQGLGTEVSGAVAPVSVSVLVGGFIFAVGMQIGGGCGCGTLAHLGAGATSLALTLLGFVAGSVAATFHTPFWSSTPSLGTLTLGEALGWSGAVTVQLLVFALLAAVSWWIERRQGRIASVAATGSAWARLAGGPWPLAAGGLALAALNTATLAVAGHPWAITWGFTLWGGKVLQASGYDLAQVPFWSGQFQQDALTSPVLADVTSVMDVGIVLGALLGAGLAGRFAPRPRVPLNIGLAAVGGGLLLGYGARIAFGCNIGAYFSGIASTSLHGWLWWVAALVGTVVGVRLRDLFRLDASKRSAR
jgi:uncharacterized membrane protein YedE/YeeE